MVDEPHDSDRETEAPSDRQGNEQLDRRIERLIRAVEFLPLDSRAHLELCLALEQRGRSSDQFLVTVITPTIGTPQLERALMSVQGQTYPQVEHLVVVDRPEAADDIRRTVSGAGRRPIQLLVLPYNTGSGGFNGHRIYAAGSSLARGHFVAFLDEDNWWEAEHLASLVQLATVRGLEWAYALRKIVDRDGRKIAHDDCESLGRWPVWHNPELHLIDVNCYLLRRDLAVSICPLWFRRFRVEESPDFAICRALLARTTRFSTTGRYTVNYRLGSTPGSVKAEFFVRGNAAMRARFGARFPWANPDGESQ
jgi:hypothetical protein